MKINRKQKELVRIYIFLFAIIFILMNWNNVSWMFNYRAISGLVYDFFNPYQESPLLASANNNFIPNVQAAANPQQVAKAEVKPPKEYPYSDKDNSLEIPSLGLTAPLVIGKSTNVASLEKDLNGGVVYYPGSVLPGQNGQIVVLGHSAPPNWPHIKYDWVFSHINDLTIGDSIILYFNNRQYTYKVIQKDIVAKGEEIGVSGLDGSNNVLTIVSCWPPGKNYKRITVAAELVKN